MILCINISFTWEHPSLIDVLNVDFSEPSAELTWSTYLVAHYGVEHSYSKFSGKKVNEELTAFLPNLPDTPGMQDNRYAIYYASWALGVIFDDSSTNNLVDLFIDSCLELTIKMSTNSCYK